MDQTASLDGLLAYFDLNPSAFPWSSSRCSTIASTRSKYKTLFYDELLMLAGVETSLYPPSDLLSLRRLLSSIQSSSFDKLKKDSLLYYLLLDSSSSAARGQGELEGRVKSFEKRRLLPSQFVRLTKGYWCLDNGLPELAITHLTSLSLSTDFIPKIIQILHSSTSPTLVLRFLRLAKPPLDSRELIFIKLDVLARTSVREAWMYMRSFEQGQQRKEMMAKVFECVLTPKPLPIPLKQLLTFPYTQFESDSLSDICIHPPSSFPPTSVNVLRDLAHTRLIAQGRFLEAIKLDRSIGAKGQQAEKRRAVLMGAVRLLPEVQRRILELEMDEGREEEDRSAEGGNALVEEEESRRGHGDVAMGRDQEMAASSFKAVQQQQQAKSLPLSASQTFRTSSPQLAVHRASMLPTSSATGPSSSPAADVPRNPFAFPPTSSTSSSKVVPPQPTSRTYPDLGRSILSHTPPPMAPAPSSPSASSTALSAFANANPQPTSSSFDRASSPFSRPPPSAPPAASLLNSSRARPTSTAVVPQPASPFAQAAQRASMAASRSHLSASSSSHHEHLGGSLRDRNQASPIPSSQMMIMSEDDDEEQEERPLARRPPPPSSSKPKSQSRNDKPPTPPKQASPPPKQPEQQENNASMAMDQDEDDFPGAFPSQPSVSPTPPSPPPAAKPTRSSHRRTNSTQQQPNLPSTAPSRPRTRTTSNSTSTATSSKKPTSSASSSSKPKRQTGGYFAPQSSDDDDDNDDEEAEEAKDTLPSPPRPTRKRPTTSSTNTTGRHVRTRSTSVLSSQHGGSDDEGPTPAATAAARRSLRSSVTASPEAARRAATGAKAGGKGRGTKAGVSGKKGQEGEKGDQEAKPAVRRSTRKTAGRD